MAVTEGGSAGVAQTVTSRRKRPDMGSIKPNHARRELRQYRQRLKPRQHAILYAEPPGTSRRLLLRHCYCTRISSQACGKLGAAALSRYRDYHIITGSGQWSARLRYVGIEGDTEIFYVEQCVIGQILGLLSAGNSYNIGGLAICRGPRTEITRRSPTADRAAYQDSS